MNYDARKVIQSELDSGELLKWSGMPKQGAIFRGADVFMIPFSLLWGGFAIFWEIMAFAIPSKEAGAIAYIFPLFGLPFIAIGLYMIFGRFIHDSKKRAKTFYGLTNKRVIIVSGIFSKNVKSLNLRNLTDISLSEKSDRSGTINFGQDNPLLSFFGGTSFPGMGSYSVPRFELIQNAKDIYNQILMLQDEH